MHNWWTNRQILSQMIDWGYELEERHAGKRILSLGQSPAWIVNVAAAIRKLRGGHANVTYIPFTGGFLKRVHDAGNGPMAFQLLSGAAPSPGRLERYFNLLSHIGCLPEQILSSGKPVVLTEMIKDANGLASFFNVWTRNLGEGDFGRLKDRLHTHIYDIKYSTNRDELSVAHKETPVSLSRLRLGFEQSEILEGITPHNRAEPSTSRLVPMYRLSARAEDKGLEIIPNRENRMAIRAALHENVQKREQEAARLRRRGLIAPAVA